MSKASEHQPPPANGDLPVLEFVVQDLRDRAKEGQKKYGTLLKTHNGREALWDAYQEALDLCMYLRQRLLEEEHPKSKVPIPEGHEQEPAHYFGANILFPISLARAIGMESARRGVTFGTCVLELLEGTEKVVPLILNRPS